MRHLAAGIAAVLYVAGSAGGAVPAVDAGSLRASLDPAHWHLTFTDASGRIILTESVAQSLGFRTAAGWQQATRLVSLATDGRRRLDAVAETTDPLGRRLIVAIRPDAEGVIAVAATLDGPTDDVLSLGIAFDATPDERFFGLGERADTVDHRGNDVENYVADGPYQVEERPLVSLFVPTPGFRPRDDATYFPVPWLLSSRGVGVLLDNAETSYFHVASESPDRWSFEVTGVPDGVGPPAPPSTITFRVFAGPEPADVLRRFTARTGRQPAPAAPWIFGPWIQVGGSLDDRKAQLAKLRIADAPFSVVQTYTHYLPCGDQVGHEDDERALVQAMHATGAAVTTYFNPMICESYAQRFDEAARAGALTRDPTGQPYVYDYTGSTVFRVGQFDFSARAGRAFYGRLLAEAIADGHDGWMEDFGEYTPLDAHGARGLTGTAYHNLYPLQYHCGAYEAVRRAHPPVVQFQRSGWTGAARCAQVVWGGDPSTDWGFDGLTSALRSGLGMGFSGIGIWGSDIGGYFALADRALTPEMLTRWVQFGAVSGVMRTEHNGFALPAKTRPQIYDDDQIANWKRYAKLRTQLYPYIAAAADTYRRTGLPLMRHLALSDPDDPAAVARDDEFLFGADILAAPVLAPATTSRDVYLPQGAWVDLWRAGLWDSAAGSFVMGDAAITVGGRTVTVPAPLDELPLFVRAGAVVPLLPADVDTLADAGDPALGVIALADRADRAVLLAFPRGSSEATMFSAGERLRSREADGEWDLEVAARRDRRFELQASLRTLVAPFTPCAVTWDGGALGAWSYDDATGVLRATFTGRRGRLRVRRCN